MDGQKERAMGQMGTAVVEAARAAAKQVVTATAEETAEVTTEFEEGEMAMTAMTVMTEVLMATIEV